MTLSMSFYLGLGALLLLLLAAGALVYRAEYPLVDRHANPTPAGPVPNEVLVLPGSNLYHAGADCPYSHRQARPLAREDAMRHGLVPCPYCVGNSSARLTPGAISQARPR
jgi:hypothetical protein